MSSTIQGMSPSWRLGRSFAAFHKKVECPKLGFSPWCRSTACAGFSYTHPCVTRMWHEEGREGELMGTWNLFACCALSDEVFVSEPGAMYPLPWNWQVNFSVCGGEWSFDHIWLPSALHPALGSDESKGIVCRRPEGLAFSSFFAEAKERN